jgi:hypothetical protein
MSVLNKFKIRQDLKQKLEKEEESRSGGRKKDARILPYYDMKFGEKVKVLIVPDENGNLWHRYSSHGPNMKISGLSAISCRRNNDHEECPICQRGFDLLQESKDRNDPALKEEAKRWFPKDTTIMSVIVLEAPFEVPIADDGNEVKLMYVPYAIEALIKNALAEGQIDEDSILTTPLWVKKSIKKGTKDTPDYSSSYFDYRSQVSDDELAAFEDSVVEPYNYENLDLVPDSVSLEDAEEWLEEAIKKDEKQKQRKSGSSSSRDDDDAAGSGEPKKLKSAAERLKERRAATDEAPEEEEKETSEPEETESEPEPENSAKSRAQALRERLAKNRNK